MLVTVIAFMARSTLTVRLLKQKYNLTNSSLDEFCTYHSSRNDTTEPLKAHENIDAIVVENDLKVRVILRKRLV